MEAKVLVRGFEVAQETRPPENSPREKCCHVDIHFILLSMLEVLHRRTFEWYVDMWCRKDERGGALSPNRGRKGA